MPILKIKAPSAEIFHAAKISKYPSYTKNFALKPPMIDGKLPVKKSP